MRRNKRFIICEVCGYTYKKQPINCGGCGNDNSFWEHAKYMPAIELPSLKQAVQNEMVTANGCNDR